ncbi:hypothetical protein C8J57DRAFT_1247545 [Mycena rebaudengoi]|nr:hypothetical protein C8J57DRAFT_1247545 [Mycena rebaudengoi]
MYLEKWESIRHTVVTAQYILGHKHDSEKCGKTQITTPPFPALNSGADDNHALSGLGRAASPALFADLSAARISPDADLHIISRSRGDRMRRGKINRPAWERAGRVHRASKGRPARHASPRARVEATVSVSQQRSSGLRGARDYGGSRWRKCMRRATTRAAGEYAQNGGRSPTHVPDGGIGAYRKQRNGTGATGKNGAPRPVRPQPAREVVPHPSQASTAARARDYIARRGQGREDRHGVRLPG